MNRGPQKRTRDKRIEITRIVRIKQLFHALAANRHIRRNRRDRALSLQACLDAEVLFPERGHIFHMSRIDPARKRDCLGKLPRKAVALFGGSLYFNVNSRGSVNYPAGKSQTSGETVHGGSATDALKDSRESNMFAHPAVGSASSQGCK